MSVVQCVCRLTCGVLFVYECVCSVCVVCECGVNVNVCECGAVCMSGVCMWCECV